MQIIDDMLANGYREYKPNKIVREFATRHFQKRLWDGDKHTYSIDCYYYPGKKLNPGELKEMVEFVVRFFREDEFCFDVECHFIEDQSLEYVEGFFASVYSKLKCIPDIHNQ